MAENRYELNKQLAQISVLQAVWRHRRMLH